MEQGALDVPCTEMNGGEEEQHLVYNCCIDQLIPALMIY
jgi:hypothetical protein